MKSVLLLVSCLLLALVAYLCWWPVPIDPIPWQAPEAPPYSGPHAVNQRLAHLNLISLGAEKGPEHIALGPDGRLYAATASGRILRMHADGSNQEVFAHTGGRVLGFDFDAAGNLIAADAYQGLLMVRPDQSVIALATELDGDPIRYANAVVVADNGIIYFSDSSQRFAPTEWGGTFAAAVLDIMEQSLSGRVLAYDPASASTRILVTGLSFANGLALSRDQEHLFVAETGRYRVWKIALAAQNIDLRQEPDQARVLLDNLPGYPDNLMRGQDNRIWLGFTGPRSARVDGMANKPFLRKVILRLPRFLWPLPEAYGHVIAFDEDGTILVDLQDPDGAYPKTTGLTETQNRRYVHNLELHQIGWQATPPAPAEPEISDHH